MITRIKNYIDTLLDAWTGEMSWVEFKKEDGKWLYLPTPQEDGFVELPFELLEGLLKSEGWEKGETVPDSVVQSLLNDLD